MQGDKLHFSPLQTTLHLHYRGPIFKKQAQFFVTFCLIFCSCGGDLSRAQDAGGRKKRPDPGQGSGRFWSCQSRLFFFEFHHRSRTVGRPGGAAEIASGGLDGIEGDRVFAIKGDSALSNGFSPEEIISPEKMTADGRKLTDEQKTFLYEFAVWIYRAIAQFKEKHPNTKAVWEQKEKQSGAFRRKFVTNTLLDVILALRRFHMENQDYFMFKIKEKHSGENKINWTRTIAKSPAIIQKRHPLSSRPTRTCLRMREKP